jgi:hypothetical protein
LDPPLLWSADHAELNSRKDRSLDPPLLWSADHAEISSRKNSSLDPPLRCSADQCQRFNGAQDFLAIREGGKPECSKQQHISREANDPYRPVRQPLLPYSTVVTIYTTSLLTAHKVYIQNSQRLFPSAELTNWLS